MLSEERKKKLRDENKQKSQRQDNKQHCQKILQGISKFDNNSANRAIWELMQNARDLSDHSHVVITLEPEKLIFAHNGKPFNFETFTSLVKQVSSEEKEDPNAAGQFGTGFMTTHKFSRKIKIKGSLEVDENEYVLFEDFILDRTATEVGQMIKDMGDQLGEVDKLSYETETTPMANEWTSFTYELDDSHRPAVIKGVADSFELIPYVMVINDRIEEVTINDRCNGKSVKYLKSENYVVDDECHLKYMLIKAGDKDVHCYYLQSEDCKDIIVLPLQSEHQAKSIKGIAKLFIFFPLLGTENFGFNIVCHSERFYPLESRDGVVLPHNNKEEKYKYDHDELVLNEMLEMYFSFLKKRGSMIKDACLIAPVTIDISKFQDDQLKFEYFNRLKNLLVSNYLKIPLLEVGKERVSVFQKEKVKFLAPDILEFLKKEEGKGYFDVVYEYAQLVSPLPAKGECIEWSSIVAEWNSNAKEHFVTVEDIVDQIISTDAKEKLHEFLLFLKDSGQSFYFSTKALIPNRDGIRKQSGCLRNAKDITDELYFASKPLIPSDTDMFIDNDYNDVCEPKLTEYTRDNLKKSMNEYVNSQRIVEEPFKDHVVNIINYCSIYPVQNGSSARNKTMPYICELMDVEYEEVFVPPIVEADKEQELYRTAFDVLTEYVLKYIELKAEENNQWYKTNGDLLYNILSSLSNKERPTSCQKEVFPRYAIIPNQLGVLKRKDELFVMNGRDVIPTEDQKDLFDYYQRVVGSNLKEKFVEERYLDFLTFCEVEPKAKATEIDEKLKETKYLSPVTIEILDHLDRDVEGGYWKRWFDNIESNKPKIFLDRLQGNKRSYAYKFMKTDNEEKMALATELMENPRMKELLEKAQEIISQEHAKQSQFKHLLAIGKGIEDRLRNKLDLSLLDIDRRQSIDEDLTVDDIQNGQDIIVRYKGHDILYVEVKSKWNFDRPAHMSTNQMRMAVMNPDSYALCCVDLTQYSSEEVKNIGEDIIISNTYVHFDIGEKLEPLLGNIVRDERTNEDSLKITDYQSNINKSIFVKGDGFEELINTIVDKANGIR